MDLDTRAFPPEVCRRVVRWADEQDLPALARTSRALQHPAEARLYASLELIHSTLAEEIFTLLANCPRIAAHVRSLVLVDQDRHSNWRGSSRAWADPDYWHIVRLALTRLEGLECLCLADPSGANARVLAVPLPFQLIDARLALTWDAHLAEFLASQDRLESLYISDVSDTTPRDPLAHGALRQLHVFEGPLALIDQLVHCPLTHLKTVVDSDAAVALLPIILPELCRFKALRSLSIIGIPEALVIDSMLTISSACPQLKHLSHLALPSEHIPRLKFMQCLTRMGALAVLELDITHWAPRPVPPFQRAFALELRIHAAVLRNIVFWAGTDRFVWSWDRNRAPDPDPEPEPPAATGGAGGAGGAGAAHRSPVRSRGEMECVLDNLRVSLTQPHWPSHSLIWRGA